MSRFLVHFLILCLPLFISAQENVGDKALEKIDAKEVERANKRVREFAKGHKLFQDLNITEHEKVFLKLIEQGVSPKTLFIGCCESKVVPEILGIMNPENLFVIRVAGNFVPYDEFNNNDGITASIQYAVDVLGVTEIIVCGHAGCGIIKALFEPRPSTLNVISKWLRYGNETQNDLETFAAPNITPQERNDLAERISVIYQIEHLLTFPYIKKKVIEKQLFLHGWRFIAERGEVDYYDGKNFKFIPLFAIQTNPDYYKR
ncbi:MAG: carbonic anhydrase [Nitrosopumilus sp.]|nr:carbonic anhydrase [Nitrosopumilus sp.]